MWISSLLWKVAWRVTAQTVTAFLIHCIKFHADQIRKCLLAQYNQHISSSKCAAAISKPGQWDCNVLHLHFVIELPNHDTLSGMFIDTQSHTDVYLALFPVHQNITSSG